MVEQKHRKEDEANMVQRSSVARKILFVDRGTIHTSEVHSKLIQI